MSTRSLIFKAFNRATVLVALLIALLVVALGLPSSHVLSNGDASDPSKAPEKAKTVDEYVGSETCKMCHEKQYQKFKETKMGMVVLFKPRNAVESRGCEACHGPGRAHVEGGGDLNHIIRFGAHSNLSKKEQEDLCIQCHEKGNRMFWRGSPHESRGIICEDCHQVMTRRAIRLSSENRYNAPLGGVEELKLEQPELCLQCHQMRRAQLQRSSHMPFREGKVTCTSCHNPHGSPNPKQLIQATVNENCYSCHAERRGPFLWEHPPVVENCGNCHEAHGSTNPQLLKARAPKLCQECHNDGQHRSTAYASVLPSTGNGTPIGFNNRVLNRGCANCHSRIHGSNSPSGNYFTR
jgi:DmsE family decaheme c-type cytochrome